MNALEIDNFFNGVNRMSNLQIKFDNLNFLLYNITKDKITYEKD